MKHWTLKLAVVLLIMVMYTTHLCSNLYARYITRSSGSDEARAAMGVYEFSLLDSENSPMQAIELENIKPGGTYEYTIQLNNHKDGKVAEVSMEYYIEVETTGNLPLNYTLKNAESNQTISKITSGNTYRWNGENMQASQSSTHGYKLIVSWGEEHNDVAYASEIDMVILEIDVKQID